MVHLKRGLETKSMDPNKFLRAFIPDANNGISAL